jgi:hypothetical protein
LARLGTAHIYADDRGSNALVGLYAPPNGTLLRGSGNYVESNTGIISNKFRLDYGNGFVIEFFHVRGTMPGPRLQIDPTDINSAGNIRIGYIGGPGGNTTPGYIHSHLQFRVNGVLTDPRKIYCGY